MSGRQSASVPAAYGGCVEAMANADLQLGDGPPLPIRYDEVVPPCTEHGHKSVAGSGANVRVGSDVRLGGLKSAPELNGQCGAIQYFDDMKGRYHVYLENRERPVGLRPANCKTLETDDAAGKVQPIGPSE